MSTKYFSGSYQLQCNVVFIGKGGATLHFSSVGPVKTDPWALTLFFK